MIEIATPSGPAEAFVATPSAGTGPWPGVLFFVDAFGLRPVIEQMAQRIADWGYVVLVPHVFHRDGTAAQLAPAVDMRTEEGRQEAFQALLPRLQALTPDRTDPDTLLWIDALLARDDVADGPIGTTGYCMGARLATRAAGLRPDVVAAVGGFHGGGLVTDAPDSPHTYIPRATARFCYQHADQDRSMPREAIDELQRTLDGAGLTVDLNDVFPGAPHGYTMADTSSYHEAAAERHFELPQQLFSEALGGR